MVVPHSQTPLIRRPMPSELPILADLHVDCLPHGLFPRLGRRFMRRWYATFLDSPYGVALVAESPLPGDPGVVAFLVGATDQHRHVSSVLARHRLRLVLAGAAALSVRPGLLWHFLRTRAGRYAVRVLRPRPPSPEGRGDLGPTRPIAVVTAIVVAGPARNLGTGTALVRAFAAAASAAGSDRAELVTLVGTEGAGRFYERLGWAAVETHRTRDGDLVATYRVDLSAHWLARAERSPQLGRRP